MHLRESLNSALFLRADRREDGRRTFKLIVGEPLGTSFGEDVYREVFKREAAEQDRIVRHASTSSDILPQKRTLGATKERITRARRNE